MHTCSLLVAAVLHGGAAALCPPAGLPQETLIHSVDETGQRVSALRGRSFRKPLEKRLVAPGAAGGGAGLEDGEGGGAELQARMAAFEEMGLLPRDPEGKRDPDRTAFKQCVHAGMGAVYDTGSGCLHLAPDAQGFFFRISLIHALIHALQDQYHGLDDLWNSVDGDDDRRLALLAVVEGEAQFVTTRYAARHARELAATAVREGMDLAKRQPFSKALAGRRLPQILIDLQSFPYREGERFVRTVFERDGWSGVDRLLTRVPASTEQILHPRKWLANEDPPQRIRLAGLSGPLGPSWRKIFENTLGELGCSCLVRETGDAIRALRVGSGWGGDRYALYRNQDNGIQGLHMAARWDTPEDAWQFFNAMERGLAFLLDAAPTRKAEEGNDRILIEGTKGTALLMLRGDTVLILKGFALGPGALQNLSERAWPEE